MVSTGNWDKYCRALSELRTFFERPEIREIWNESSPSIWSRDDGSLQITHYIYEKEDPKAKIIALTKILGNCKKDYSGSGFYLNHDISPDIHLTIACDRNEVCTRKVIGTKIEPAYTVPERTVEEVEWECHSLLGEKE